MNIADHLRLSEREQVSVVQQTLGRVLEAVSANVRFRHAIGTYRRTHRSIDNRDAILEDLLNRMLAGFRHVSMMPLGVSGAATSARCRRPLAQHRLKQCFRRASALPYFVPQHSF